MEKISDDMLMFARHCMKVITNDANKGTRDYEIAKERIVDYFYEKYGEDVIKKKIAEFDLIEEKLKANPEACEPEVVAKRLVDDMYTIMNRGDLSDEIVHINESLLSDGFKKKVFDAIPFIIEQERQAAEEGNFYKGHMDKYRKVCQRVCSDLGFELPLEESVKSDEGSSR